MQLPRQSVLGVSVQGTWQKIVGRGLLRVVHVARLDMRPGIVEQEAHRETGSRVSYATEDDPPDRLQEIIRNKVSKGRQGDASDLHGSNGTIMNNSRKSIGFVYVHESPTGIIGNDSGEGSRGIKNYHENLVGIVGNDSEEVIGDDVLGHYDIYVVSKELKGQLGVALLDSGSQVSLVKESSLAKFIEEKNGNFQIFGVTGKELEIKGKVNINLENTLEPLKQECYVVDNLPRDLDMILGQDWLENAGYGFQKKTPVFIPPYCEKIVKCKTLEKGVHFTEHQTLQPGLICAASLVNCESYEFPCLVVNLTDEPACMSTEPN
ncbi:hypothetical protein B7P43_G18012 [Cryptotermes secundus]|uniref:Peptidase A2 domain-containing protein n=1 Tax=Cryptotermes secundus TaxID=105785 RepID=A0A2J7RQL0_9NEOP|nr:hypothetical protein B7P43_G18012 [Cryptotermes secundus]